MGSIEIGFSEEGADSIQPWHQLPAGAQMRFIDFSGERPKTITAVCLAENSGGEVYVHEGVPIIEPPNSWVMPPLETTPDVLEAYLAPGHIYERYLELVN